MQRSHLERLRCSDTDCSYVLSDRHRDDFKSSRLELRCKLGFGKTLLVAESTTQPHMAPLPCHKPLQETTFADLRISCLCLAFKMGVASPVSQQAFTMEDDSVQIGFTMEDDSVRIGFIMEDDSIQIGFTMEDVGN